jgi:hypothetical protein
VLSNQPQWITLVAHIGGSSHNGSSSIPIVTVAAGSGGSASVSCFSAASLVLGGAPGFSTGNSCCCCVDCAALSGWSLAASPRCFFEAGELSREIKIMKQFWPRSVPKESPALCSAEGYAGITKKKKYG